MSKTFGPEVGPSFDFQSFQQPLPQQAGTFGAEVGPVHAATPDITEFDQGVAIAEPREPREVPERPIVLPEDVALHARTVQEERRLLDLASSDSPAGIFAFRSLINRHKGAMLSAMGNQSYNDREDLLELAASKAYDAIAQGKYSKDAENLRGWLSTIARNAMLDKVRRDKVRPQEILDAGSISAEDGEIVQELGESPQDVQRIVEARMLVDEALAQLSPDHREVVVNVTMLGKSVNEYARESGLPPGTVKSRTHYAIRELRKILKKSNSTK